MCNVADNGDVGIWWGTFDVECSRERLREIWWGLVMWNVVRNGDVECGGER